MDTGRKAAVMFDGPSPINSKAKDFPKGFVWLNTEWTLLLDDLKGHVVFLDFWIYCCIICMHTLPDLGWKRNNFREAIGRYEISRPVIFDRNMEI